MLNNGALLIIDIRGFRLREMPLFYGVAISTWVFTEEENKECVHWLSNAFVALAKANHMTMLNYKMLKKCNSSVFPQRKVDGR